MRDRFKALLAAATAILLLAGPAQATLLGRDIKGHAVAGSDASAVFLYDDDRSITWLRDANAGTGFIYDNGLSATDGAMTWACCTTLGADPDTNRSAGLHSVSVVIANRMPQKVSRVFPPPV